MSTTAASIDPRVPGPLRDGERTNFDTLLRAAGAGDLAVMSAIRKSDGAQVALVCAMGRDDDGNYLPTPLATLIEGNPYELFEDPTP